MPRRTCKVDKPFGTSLTFARQRAKLTMAEIAAKTGVPKHWVHRMEHGRMPSDAAISRDYRARLKELFFDTFGPQPVKDAVAVKDLKTDGKTVPISLQEMIRALRSIRIEGAQSKGLTLALDAAISFIWRTRALLSERRRPLRMRSRGAHVTDRDDLSDPDLLGTPEEIATFSRPCQLCGGTLGRRDN